MENAGAARSCGILSLTEARPMSGFAKAAFANERQVYTSALPGSDPCVLSKSDPVGCWPGMTILPPALGAGQFPETPSVDRSGDMLHSRANDERVQNAQSKQVLVLAMAHGVRHKRIRNR
jgi:hypothetical protein